jgi:FMN phosphatase YigB (HAD superfamily)
MNVDFKGIKAVVFDFDGTLYNNKRFPFWFVLANLFEIFLMKKERSIRKEMMGIDLNTREDFEKEFYGRLAKQEIVLLIRQKSGMKMFLWHVLYLFWKNIILLMKKWKMFLQSLSQRVF